MRLAVSPSFGVQHKFLEFYLEIEELRRAAGQRQGPEAAPATVAPEAVAPGAVAKLPSENFAQETRRKAGAILDRQYRDTLHTGSVAAGIYRDALFVMAAYADEVFIRLEWEGSRFWLAHLLETQYFGTQSAGEDFFTRISDLLSDNDPAKDELRTLYMTALALGFRGQYTGKKNSETVAHRLRKELFDHDAARRRPVPETYLSVAGDGPVRRLSSPLKWWGLACGVVLLWLGVSAVIWRYVSYDIHKSLHTDEKPAASNLAGQGRP